MRNIIQRIGTGVLVLAGVMALADHNSPSGSVGRLMYESQELTQVVRYVGLNYQVQQSVERFNYEVSRLADCVRYNGGGRLGSDRLNSNVGDHLDNPVILDHLEDPGIPYSCRANLDMARRAFVSVDRYLSDTYYDFPQVYRAYMDTREALYSIQVGGFPNPGPFPGPGPVPGPGFQNVSCVATDAGWEEHGGGHVGYGRNVAEAQRTALMACQQFHGRCRIRQCR